jgi:hypothetical protein
MPIVPYTDLSVCFRNALNCAFLAWMKREPVIQASLQTTFETVSSNYRPFSRLSTLRRTDILPAPGIIAA